MNNLELERQNTNHLAMVLVCVIGFTSMILMTYLVAGFGSQSVAFMIGLLAFIVIAVIAGIADDDYEI